MLTRTRNELLLVGAVALIIGVTGTAYLRMRAARTAGQQNVTPHRYEPTSELVPGDECPVLTSWSASPLQTSVGEWIDVAALAIDPDADETVTYAWLPAANFVSPNAPTTRFSCAEAGQQVITLKVTDSHRARSCTTQISIAVACVAR